MEGMDAPGHLTLFVAKQEQLGVSDLDELCVLTHRYGIFRK